MPSSDEVARVAAAGVVSAGVADGEVVAAAVTPANVVESAAADASPVPAQATAAADSPAGDAAEATAAGLDLDSSYLAFVAERREQILSHVKDACERAGRGVGEVSLFAVSKTVDVPQVVAAMRAGYANFAENRPQELTRKLEGFHAAGIAAPRFDMIGNLQKNKINQVLGRAARIQSVSGLELARAVSSRAVRAGLQVPALLECNVSGEASKGGFTPDEVRAAAEELAGLEGLKLEGLMCMAPAHDASAARKTFSDARELLCELRERTGLALPEFSCGMSDDFEIAVEEGSTLVRLGRIVFSPEYPFS